MTLPIHIIGDMTRYHWATASRIAATGLRPGFGILVLVQKKHLSRRLHMGVVSAPLSLER